MRKYIVQLRRISIASILAFAIAISPLGGAEFASAAGGTATWTGAAGDRKFSTAANWVENAIPENGDELIFNTVPVPGNGALSYYEYLDNDVDVRYSAVSTVMGGSGNPNNYSYYLQNVLKLQANPTWTASNNLSVYVLAGVEVAGNITIQSGEIRGPITATGVITVPDGAVLRYLPASAAQLVVQNGGAFACFDNTMNPVVTYPLLLGGGSGTGKPLVSPSLCAGGVGSNHPSYKATFNDVTLLADSEVSVMSPNVVEVKSLVRNGHSLTRTSQSTGQLITPDGVQENQPKDTTLSGDLPTQDENVTLKETATLDGVRSVINVGDGGVLQGNGTIRDLNVSGTVSPGNQIGTITIIDRLNIYTGSTYQVDILNKDSYDQLVIQAGATQVDITDATLDLQFLPGGVINQGETFTIIDNQSAIPVTGTFAGLAEGAQIVIGNAVFAISYVGGDGNDVVLTALTTAKAPGTPNTGFQIITANPILTAVLGLAAAGTLFIASRRFAQK